MHGRTAANRPEPGANLRQHERELGNGASGKPAQDGYTVYARRPRVPFVTETIEPERASEIEGYGYATGIVPLFGPYD